jgi:hypothetical protein
VNSDDIDKLDTNAAKFARGITDEMSRRRSAVLRR